MTHRIVVAGGGYAGLVTATRLAYRTSPSDVRITVVNGRPQFVERVRLHQLMAGQRLRGTSIAQLVAGTGIDVVIDHITGIDAEARLVHLAGSPDLQYDTLVYALGSGIGRTDVPGAAEHAYALADLASAETAAADIRSIAAAGGTVTIVGAGASGIEAVAELAESLPSLHVQLVSADEPGSWLSERGRDHLRATFDRLGVAVHAGSPVRAVCSEGTHLGDELLPSDAVIWAAGLRVPPTAFEAGITTDVDGRIRTDSTLRSISHPEIYGVGDAALVHTPEGPPVRMGCGTGMPMGFRVADTIAARIAGKPGSPHLPRYYLQNLSLGRRDGLIQVLHRDDSPRNAVLTGRPAAAFKEAVVRGTLIAIRHPRLYVAPPPARRKCDVAHTAHP
ncbi:NAD(P)/FAD-dependent oxidoreductase [Pseudonocardia sp. TRM90224]|uniref:NAD(P)/FAD-dependent oxidoreductase n=1 Tax=Pseudonocardia sp. TRM90224 TaxID=2812678 RepID=UPI001E473025|nr:FAD-dependent oxidoreductase [Pseudonocardia sp. TRM90224]